MSQIHFFFFFVHLYSKHSCNSCTVAWCCSIGSGKKAWMPLPVHITHLSWDETPRLLSRGMGWIWQLQHATGRKLRDLIEKWKISACVCLFVYEQMFSQGNFTGHHMVAVALACTIASIFHCELNCVGCLFFFLNSYFISHQITWCHCVGVKGEMEEQCCEIGLVSVQP